MTPADSAMATANRIRVLNKYASGVLYLFHEATLAWTSWQDGGLRLDVRTFCTTPLRPSTSSAPAPRLSREADPAGCASLQRVPGFGVLDRLPYALRGCRHLDIGNAEIRKRIHDRIHHRGERAGATGLAATLDAERIGRRRNRQALEADLRHVGGARHRIVHERSGQ